MALGLGRGGFDVEVDLLTDVEGFALGLFEVEDDLEDAGVDAFGAFAGEGFFGNDEGVDADEGEGEAGGGIAFEVGGGGAAGLDEGGILFIDVGSDLEAIDIAEDHEGFGRVDVSVFAFAEAEAEDAAVAAGADGEDVAFGFGLGELGLGGFEEGAAVGEEGFGGLEGELAAAEFVAGEDAGGGGGVDAEELVLGFGEGDLGLGEGGVLDVDLGAQGGDAGEGFAVVDLEEGVAGFDVGADAGKDLGDEAGFGGSDVDVFVGGLDDAGGGDGGGVGGAGRFFEGRGSGRVAGLGAGEGDAFPDAEEGEGGEGGDENAIEHGARESGVVRKWAG